MKKLLPLLPIAGLLTYLSLGSNSSGFPSASGASSTGGCSCHGSNLTSTQLLLSGIPTSGWVPGTTYTMTATVANSARVAAGFDITIPGINGGSISNPSTNTILNGSTGIHHTAPKSFVSGSASWTFSWTAPTSAAATAVTFNMAGNAVNLNGSETGDIPNLTTFTFNKAATPPTAPTVTASGSTSICSGQPFPTLTASSSGATAYTWFSGATQVGTGASFTPTAAGTYTATATNTAGTSTSSSPITITVNPTPVITAVQSDATLCPGQCDTITLTSSVANTSYAFTIAGGGSGTATGNRIIFCLAPPPATPTTPQVMTITGTAANCNGTTTQTITPNPLPSAVFTHTSNGLTYSFTGPTGTNLSYNWDFGNGQTSTVANPTVTYATSGSYSVTLNVTNTQTGCSALFSQNVQATSSIAGVVGLQGFRFGPNPARRELTLHTGKLRAEIRLLDLSGKAIATLRTRDEVSIEKTVSLAHLSAGLYFLEVTTSDARGVEKLIVR